MQRYLSIVALLLAGVLLIEAQAGAQEVTGVEAEPPLIAEPPVPAVSAMDFDRAKLELAREQVLRTRNWFLATGAVFGLGWVLLGAGMPQCETINGVEECTTRGGRLRNSGAALVTFGSIALIATSITFGVRSGQRKRLEHQTLQRLTEGGLTLPPLSFETYRLIDAQDRSARARNGLIGSAATFSVGWIFLGLAIPRCEAGNNGLQCTNPGYAHLAAGLTLTATGMIGMIVSGALLGVRKSKARGLEHSIGQRRGARLRWDPSSGSFVF